MKHPHGHYAGSPNRRQKKPLRKPLFYALIAACACVFVISAVLLIRYYADIASSRNASAQLSDIYQAAQESSPATSVPSAAPSAAPSACSPSPFPASADSFL